MMEKLLFTLIDALNFGDKKKKKKQNGPVWEHVLILDRKFHINPGAKKSIKQNKVSFVVQVKWPSIFEYRLLTCLFRCLCKIFSSVSGLTTSCSLFEPRLIKYQPRTNPGLTNDMLSRANTVLECVQPNENNCSRSKKFLFYRTFEGYRYSPN